MNQSNLAHKACAGVFLRRIAIRIIFGILVCVLFGNGRCATTKGGGERRADEIIQKAEAIEKKANDGKSIVNNSHATPEEKAQLNEIFDSMAKDSRDVRDPVKQLGKDVDTNKGIADSLAAQVESLKKYRNIVIGLLVGAAIAGFSWFKFFRK
jgi:hypothetical protein